jgi:C-terminal processing protease CtpA/Prc
VKAGSPLEGIIFAGDRIIAIANIDTREMTVSNISQIMEAKFKEPKKITVLSKTYRRNVK